jgi:hypothetical protein
MMDRWKRAATALLLPAMLSLPGCTPPPPHIYLTNKTGQQLSFKACHGRQIVLAGGDRYNTADLRWYDIKCYLRRPFVIERADGGSWTYSVAPNYRFPPPGRGASRADVKRFRAHVRESGRGDARIESDGTISFAYYRDGKSVSLPELQPIGYPLKPIGD